MLTDTTDSRAYHVDEILLAIIKQLLVLLRALLTIGHVLSHQVTDRPPIFKRVKVRRQRLLDLHLTV